MDEFVLPVVGISLFVFCASLYMYGFWFFYRQFRDDHPAFLRSVYVQGFAVPIWGALIGWTQSCKWDMQGQRRNYFAILAGFTFLVVGGSLDEKSIKIAAFTATGAVTLFVARSSWLFFLAHQSVEALRNKPDESSVAAAADCGIRAIPSLLAICAESDLNARTAAIESLRRIGIVTPGVRDAFDIASRSDDPLLRMVAFDAIRDSKEKHPDLWPNEEGSAEKQKVQ